MSFPIVLFRLFFFSIFLLILNFPLLGQTDFNIQKGKTDLQNWNFEQNPVLELSGEWEFYPNQLISTKSKINQSINPHYVEIPSFWNYINVEGKDFGSFGYGTYRLQINLPKNVKDLALKVFTVATNCKIYVNGKLLQEIGKVGTDKNTTSPHYQPQIIALPNITSGELELIVQVANFHHFKGGLWNTIKLGKEKELYLKQQSKGQLDAFFWGSFFTIGIFFLGLYVRRRKDNLSILYFALFCISMSLRTMVIGEIFLAPLGWYVLVQLEYGTLYITPIFFYLFIKSLFPEEFIKTLTILALIPIVLASLIFLSTPPHIFTLIVPYFQLALVFVLAYATYIILRAYLRKREGAAFVFWAFITLFIAITNDILYSQNIINTFNLTAWSIMFLIISQALMLTYRFFTILDNNEKLSAELQYANQNLENIVGERTKELTEKNQELEQITEEITNQKNSIEKQRDETESLYSTLTSSINAAEQIQKAILPYKSKLERLLKNYFIINRPKDVVSGDFYWLNEIDGKTILVVADCTGHGVQGAFMTLIGANLLDKIVRIYGVVEPSQILTRLHEEVYTVLDQENTHNNSGMDAVALCWEKQGTQTEIMFSGAKNNLFYFSNQDLKELKGTRKSIGGIQNEGIQFDTQKITLNPEDIIYLGSDGLEDQNNVKRKKIGKPRLMSFLSENANLPLKNQQEKIELFLEQHMKNTSQRDDILWMGIRF